jgi:hypothetical protein
MRYIYEITNLINNKTYYGQRTLSEKLISQYRTPMSDKYFGSGKILNCAIEKYGKENFKKSIIIQGDFTKDELDKFEKCIIRIMRLNDKAEYNIANGGGGGATRSRADGSYDKAFCEKIKEILRNKFKYPEFRDTVVKRVKEAKIKNGTAGKFFGGTKGLHWKMPEGHQAGEKNSQYGKHWYNNGKENIKATSCPPGFVLGRLLLK